MLECSALKAGSTEASSALDIGKETRNASVSPVRNITELAALAGVAVSTVSRSLANKPGVKLETRKRIQRLAELHNFSINTNAQSLRAGKGGERQVAPSSGLVNACEQQPDAFTLRLLKTIFDQATRSGFDVSSKRVEAERIENQTPRIAAPVEPKQSARNCVREANKTTIQINIDSGFSPRCEVEYCIKVSTPDHLTSGISWGE